MMKRIAGMAWFDADDYEAFRLLLPDRLWHDTYDEWLANAHETMKHLAKRRVSVAKAPVRTTSFIAWCEKTGREPASELLAEFALDFVKNRDKHRRR
ncbi:MAG TPA: hypothetical protein VGO76_21665 [Luteibacter sp.]|jgi:hypothetical protein|nr:hypothetical protein [Luteibacter sp.]